MAGRLELKATLQGGHTQPVWFVAWAPNGLTLASCGGDKTVCLWMQGEASSSLSPSWVLKAKLTDAHERTVRRVAWSPDGRFLAAASFDSTTSVWENRNGEFVPIATLEGHENEVKAAAFDSSGSLLATCSRDKSVWIWEMVEGEFECVSVLHGHTQDVKSVLWHPYEPLLVSCSYDDTIKLWREGDDDWYCQDTLHAHASTVWDVAFSRSGNELASGSDDRTLVLWRRDGSGADAKWRSYATVHGQHERTIYSVDWAKCGSAELVASGAGDNSVRVFDASAAGVPCVAVERQAHAGDVNCVRWNPKVPYLLASGGDDNAVRLWTFAPQ